MKMMTAAEKCWFCGDPASESLCNACDQVARTLTKRLEEVSLTCELEDDEHRMLDVYSAADKLARVLGKPQWLDSVQAEMRDSRQTITVYASRSPKPWPKIFDEAAWEGFPLLIQAVKGTTS